jgi:hypothetical protein
MKRKKRKRTAEEIAHSASVQQALLERLAYYEAKLEEERTGVPVEPVIRAPTSDEVRERLRGWIEHHRARLEAEHGAG